MFHNQSRFKRAVYDIGPVNLLVVITAIIVFVVYQIFKMSKHEHEPTHSELDKFAEYIYDYAIYIQKMGDTEAEIVLKSFEENNKMLSVESFDGEGNAIENYTWDVNAEAFMDVILKIQQVLVLTCSENSKFYKSEKAWKMAKFFINKVMTKIPTPARHQSFPWGSNWYQFSITFPRFLMIASYLHRKVFNVPNRDLENTLASYTNSYLISPQAVVGVESMGWLRDGPNAVMMAIPYIGGKLLMKTYNPKDTIVQYSRNYVSLNNVTDGEGYYPDGGFIFHTNLRAYGYIYGSYSDFIILGKFHSISMEKIYKIFEIFEHPTIKRHFSAFFTRSGSLMSDYSGKLGFYVVDSIKVVAVKTTNWLLSFNGQSKNLCFYEADRAYSSWPMCWLMNRQFLYEDSDTKWYKTIVNRYPGVISYNNVLWELPSTTTTTETFTPIKPKCMIVKHDNAIGFRNEYTIASSKFNIEVVEFSLITESGIHSHYTIFPDVDMHNEGPITVSVNFDQLVDGDCSGFGKPFKFKKSTSFVYGDDYKTTNVFHPFTNKQMVSLQIRPNKLLVNSDGNEYCNAAFSTIHADTNEVVSIPTTNKIETGKYKLEYDQENKNYLMLSGNKTMSITKFSDSYQGLVTIPQDFIHRKCGEESLIGKTISNGMCISGTEQGNQITFNIR